MSAMVAAPVPATPTQAGANPFTARTALALVLFGCLAFVAVLWMIGNGMADGDANNGGAHADGRGLNGYAALSALLERRGYSVRHSRSEAGFKQPGLLVLTPPALADADAIDEAVRQHRPFGPTLLVLPKWVTSRVSTGDAASGGAKPGWVRLSGVRAPRWSDELRSFGRLDVRDEITDRGAWHGLGLRGVLPDRAPVQTLSSGLVATLVSDAGGQVLAGYRYDGSAPAALGGENPSRAQGAQALVIVAEPDLLNNYGMADRNRAMLALTLVDRTADRSLMPITFDLTLNGIKREANLLTLAFTPPFLAATLCLLLAGLATGWRAFLRFGPPRAPTRAIAFGKQALVANTAALIVRSRRLHLLGRPYAAAARQRLTRAFALPRGSQEAETRAIDRAAKAHGAPEHAFSQAVARLAEARSERELVRAASELHALERTLTR